MKNFQKTAIAITFSLLTMCSCSSVKNQDTSQNSDQINATNLNSELISYYESEISRLEESILNIKEDHYIAQKQYQSKIQALTQQLEVQSNTETQTPNMEDVSLLPFSYVLEDGKVTIVKYTGISTNVTVPSILQGCAVTKIGEYAFDSNIESVIISEGIEEIDWFAFAGCSRLREIYIPISVRMINYGAFDYCSKDLVIKCSKGSYAEAYAKSYGLNFIAE